MIDVDIRVKVSKQWLIETVKKNRDDHRGIFEKAFKKYREAVLKYFEEELAKVRSGQEVTARWFSGVRPEDHTLDYDLVLSMLSRSTEDEVQVTGSDYRRFVQDNWEWTAQFVSTSNAYGVSTKFDNQHLDDE